MAKSQKAFRRAALLRSKTAWERRCGNLRPRRRGSRPRLCSRARSTSVGAAISRPLCRMRDQGWRDVGDAVPYGAVQISDVVRKLREGQAPPLRVVQISGVVRKPRDVGADARGGPAVSANDSRTIWATSYESTGSSVFLGGASPSPTGAGMPGCGTYYGTSRTPSPTGRCKHQIWCVNRGRGKPLPYGWCKYQTRCESAGRRGRRPLWGRDRGFYRRGDSRIARWPAAHTGNGAVETSVPDVGADVRGYAAVPDLRP